MASSCSATSRSRDIALATTPWLQQGIIALVLSSGLWLACLLPDQWRLERVDPEDEDTLRALFQRWSVVGWTVTAILFYGLWVMVSRT